MHPFSLPRRARPRAAASAANALCLALCLAATGCGGDGVDAPGHSEEGGAEGRGTGKGGSAGSGGSIPTTGGSSASGGTIPIGGTTGSGGSLPVTGGSSGSGGQGETCAEQDAQARVVPVRLAFAFDISGSMGALDYPWHDPTLKWDPIFTATRAFFEDEASEGIEASVTVFPIAGDDWVAKCEGASYAAPNVPMTALPSTAFGSAIETALGVGWGEGTPTLAVVNGVLSYVADLVPAEPASYALVLVTDGYPQGCEDNAIASVVTAVSEVADEIKTFVIGVANPPLTDAAGNMAPETVMNLSAVAVAGGTERAYLIDTGDPAATNAAFSAAIDEIREASIACHFEIPSIPDGRKFERDKVLVSHASSSGTRELAYDPTCDEPGAWHYDDPTTPAEIVLCDETCTEVQGDREASIDVTFTCETVIDPH